MLQWTSPFDQILDPNGQPITGASGDPATQTTDGLMSAADKLKLDGLESENVAHVTPLSDADPQPLGATASPGTDDTAAHGGHIHAHGAQAGGNLHAVASSQAAGFMSVADKNKLDGLSTTGATPLSNATPQPLGVAAPGADNAAARGGHVHVHGDQAGGSLHALATSTSPGFFSPEEKATLAQLAAAGPGGEGGAALTTDAPPAIGATSSVGADGFAAHGQHTHAHGDQAGGSLHSVATTGAAGFLSATDKTKLDQLATLSSIAPPELGASSIVGNDNYAAHGQHTHAHGSQLGGSLHANATSSVAGFLAAADKTKLDRIVIGPDVSVGPFTVSGADSTLIYTYDLPSLTNSYGVWSISVISRSGYAEFEMHAFRTTSGGWTPVPDEDGATVSRSKSALPTGQVVAVELSTDGMHVTVTVTGAAQWNVQVWQREPVLYDNAPADATAPTITGFTVAATSSTLGVSVTSFTATDSVGVTGYLITESATPPTSGWLSSAPSSFTAAGQGLRTLYAWARDAAGNISIPVTAQCTITLPTDTTAPAVTAFTIPATSTSLDISITSFTGTDATGVTGYMITENTTPPLAGAAGWTAQAPTTYHVSANGSYHLYPWLRDAAGNVSSVHAGATVTVAVDTTAPTITAFTIPATHDSADIPISTFTATDSVGVTGYMVTATNVAPAAGAAGWSAQAPTTFHVASSGTYHLYPWARDAAGNVSALHAGAECVATFSAPASLPLAPNATSVTWGEDVTVNGTQYRRVTATYDFTTAAQLSDWTGLGGGTLTRDAGNFMAQTGGSREIRGVQWKQTCIFESVTAATRAHGGTIMNAYAGMAASWDGGGYDPTPSFNFRLQLDGFWHLKCGTLWFDNTQGPVLPANVWRTVEWSYSTSQMRANIVDAGGTLNPAVYTPNMAYPAVAAFDAMPLGLFSLGTYNNSIDIGQISITCLVPVQV